MRAQPNLQNLPHTIPAANRGADEQTSDTKPAPAKAGGQCGGATRPWTGTPDTPSFKPTGRSVALQPTAWSGGGYPGQSRGVTGVGVPVPPGTRDTPSPARPIAAHPPRPT